jgi:hypothetical protein
MAPPSAASRSETPRRGKHGEISWLAYPLGERLNIVYVERTSEISLRALETTAHIPSQAGVPGEVCGRHRRQGLKTAASADAADGYHRTFFS